MGKRLCLISPKFSSHIGGMETHAYEFARAFATDAEYPLATVLIRAVAPDGVPAPAPEHGNGRNPLEGSGRLLESLVSRELTGDFARDAEAILRRCDVDDTIFYLNNSTWLPAVALLKQRHPRARVVLRSGGNDLVAGWIGDETDMSRPLEESRARVVAMINRGVDAVIVNSAFSYQRALAVGVRAEKMATIIGGVDCQSFRPREGPPPSAGTVRILTVARLVAFKGFAHALAAIRALHEQGIANIQYTVIGDGPERAAIERAVDGPLAGRVRLVGARHFTDIPACMRDADIFLHMPVLLCRRERGGSYIHTETMGRSVCEASASGLPVVAARVGGIPEVVEDNETGFLVPEKDSDAAARRLRDLIADADLRAGMGAKGRTRALESFDWSIVFRQYKALFA